MSSGQSQLAHKKLRVVKSEDVLLDEVQMSERLKDLREENLENSSGSISRGLLEDLHGDDIIGQILNEFSEELEGSQEHQTDKAFHRFSPLMKAKESGGTLSLKEVLDLVDDEVSHMEQTCSKLDFFVKEIHNRAVDED